MVMILKKLNLKKIGDFGFSKKHYSTNEISFIFTIMKKIIQTLYTNIQKSFLLVLKTD